jgi:hypothetical protein
LSARSINRLSVATSAVSACRCAIASGGNVSMTATGEGSTVCLAAFSIESAAAI